MNVIIRFFYLSLIACITFGLYAIFINPERYWIVFLSLPLSFIYFGFTFCERLLAICLTGIIALIVIFIATLLGSYFLAATLFLAILAGATGWSSEKNPHYFLPAITILVLGILASAAPVSIEGNLFRISFAVQGIACVILLQCLFSYRYVASLWWQHIALTLQYLANLNDEIFACFLEPAYSKNIYLFERRIHKQKITCLQALCFLQSMAQHKKIQLAKINHHALTIQKKLEQLYGLELECSQLRRRVTDFTIFNICNNEMQAIKQAIRDKFSALIILMKYPTAHITTHFSEIDLELKISALESNYANVLQATAREPLVFCLFIGALKFLNHDLDLLHHQINQHFSDELKS